MAFTIYVLIVAFVGITSAAFYGEPENNNFPRFTMPKMHHFKSSKIPKVVPKLSIPRFNAENLGPEQFMPPVPLTRDLIKAHVAGANEQYSGTSYSSHTHSTNVNGQKTFESSVSSLVNDGHNVEETILEYKQ